MSKTKKRLNGVEIERRKKEKREAEKQLREQQRAEGLDPPSRTTTSNRKSEYETVAEETEARTQAVTEQVRIFQSQLPVLLKQLNTIKDPRNPKKVKHKLTLVLIYGILSFIYQMSSRREANREMTRPMFLTNLNLLFPEIETIPHNDTLMRLLSHIDVSTLESAHIDLIRGYMRNKKFVRYLIDKSYPIALDGSQKFTRSWLWAEECLERKTKTKTDQGDTEKQYYVYVLEACLVFHNGMTIPLMTEFLEYTQGDMQRNKQDCELKAFYRLTSRIKKEFPALPILLLLDGLYPNGPMIQYCLQKKWQFMIVLQDKSLKSVWEEFEGLKKLEKNNTLELKWGNRRQHFEWVNDIEYYYGSGETKKQIIHMIICEESWEEIDKEGKIVSKRARHCWISSKPLNAENVHERCNLGARYRWGIEEGFLLEKHQGYHYEHCFSYNWNAMRGYHYLMHLAHLFNVLACYYVSLIEKVNRYGIRGFVKFIRETLAAPWLDPEVVRKLLSRPFQLRLLM
jgi:hypothetical protein